MSTRPSSVVAMVYEATSTTVGGPGTGTKRSSSRLPPGELAE